MISSDYLKERFSHNSDNGYLISRKTGKRAGYSHHSGYRMVMIDYINYKEHRVIWVMHYGDNPETIDHINGDRADNRIENLRSVPLSENLKNKRLYKNNKSGFAGVCFDKTTKTWSAHIKVNGKSYTKRCKSKDCAIKYRNDLTKLYGFHANHGQNRQKVELKKQKGRYAQD